MSDRLFKFGLAVIRDGKLLLCRPHAFRALIMPGGVQEDGEDYLAGLRREISEELGPDAQLREDTLEWLGHYEDQAASKPAHILDFRSAMKIKKERPAITSRKAVTGIR